MAKVLITLQDGQEIIGNILSFNANLPIFYVYIDKDSEKSEKVPVNMDSVKAVFFLKREIADESIVHMETIDQSVFAGTYAFRLHVEFKDGEMLHGSAHKYNPNEKGFYLVPLNPAETYERVYINARAVKRVDSRRLIGNILVDQKKITQTQLDHALRHQQEKREQKIGAILHEHKFISRDQLEESLEKQKERPKPLGEILLEAGYITEDQLQYALHVQHENRRKKLGQILVELRYLTPNDICIALATQLHLPWADLSRLKIPVEVATSLPEDIVRQLVIIPVERRDNTLVVATAEPQEPGLIGEISRFTEFNVELAVGYEDYIEYAIDRFFPKARP